MADREPTSIRTAGLPPEVIHATRALALLRLWISDATDPDGEPLMHARASSLHVTMSAIVGEAEKAFLAATDVVGGSRNEGELLFGFESIRLARSALWRRASDERHDVRLQDLVAAAEMARESLERCCA